PRPGTSQLSMFDSGANVSAATEGDRKGLSLTDVQFHVIKDRAAAEALLVKLMEQTVISVQCVYEGASPIDSQLKAMAVAFRDDEAYYLPLAGSDADSMLDVLRPAFEAENIAKAGHNLKYIVQLLRKRNIVMKGDFFDNMLAHYLIEPEAAHDQHVLALQYLGYELLPDNHPDLKELLCERAGINLQLRQKLTIELESR